MRFVQWLTLVILLTLCFSGQAFAQILNNQERAQLGLPPRDMATAEAEEAAARINQVKAEAHQEKARLHSQSGDHEQALKELDIADQVTEQVDRQNDQGIVKAINQYSRAHEYSLMGLHERARKEFKTGLSLNPNCMLNHYSDDPDFQAVYLPVRIMENLPFYAVSTVLLILAICLFVYAIRVKAFVQLLAIALFFLETFDTSEGDSLTLYRFGACATTAYIAFQLHKKGYVKWSWISGAIAVLFNPIVQIQLERITWQFIDLAAIVSIAISILATFRIAKKPMASENQNMVDTIFTENETLIVTLPGAIGRQLAKSSRK